MLVELDVDFAFTVTLIVLVTVASFPSLSAIVPDTVIFAVPAFLAVIVTVVELFSSHWLLELTVATLVLEDVISTLPVALLPFIVKLSFLPSVILELDLLNEKLPAAKTCAVQDININNIIKHKLIFNIFLFICFNLLYNYNENSVPFII